MANLISFKKLEEMVTLLFNYNKGTTFMGLYTETFPIKKVSSPYFGKLTCRRHYNVIVNFDYTGAVNRQRIKEGKEADFVAHSKGWYERVEKTPLLKHKKTETLYLRTWVQFAGPASYFLDGKQVLDIPELEKISADLPIKYASKSQKLEKEIGFKIFKLSSIKAVTVDHATHIVQG